MSTGTVNIRGKEYKTVALRVSEFREQCPAKDGWAILTEIVDRTAEDVVVKAMILHKDCVVATGYAEEVRQSSQINRTSALENCETSAIGRALAAFGLGGSEYASANEVTNAIHQQSRPRNSRPAPKPKAPLLTHEEQEYINSTLKVIAVGDNEDLDNIANDLKTGNYSPTVVEAITKAGAERREFLKKNQEKNDAPSNP